MKAAFLSALVAIGVWGCRSTPVRVSEAVSSKPLSYSAVLDYLESRVQSRIGSDLRYQRSTDGSILFITFTFKRGNEADYHTLIVTADGIREIPSYAYVWYDDQEKPVFSLKGGREWYEDNGRSARFLSHWGNASYVFQGGAVIPYKETSGVRGVVGANLVLIQFKSEARPPQRVHIRGTNYVTINYPEKTAWIVSKAENPCQPLIELPKDFEPSDAYANSNKLFLFDTYRPQGDQFVRRCLIYEESSGGYALAKQVQIPWMGGVLDFWPETGTALIEALNERHMFPTYYRFNVNTKRRSLIGFIPADDVLFLKDDVAQTLDGAIGKRK